MRLAPRALLLACYLGMLPCPGFPAPASGKNNPTLISVQGLVRVQSRINGPPVTPVVRSMLLAAGYQVVTGGDGLVNLLFGNGWNAKAASDTDFQIATPVPDHLNVTRGKVWLRVPHGNRTSLDGPAARAFLRGTEVVMEVTEGGATTLTVAEGEAEFANEKGRVVVRGGEQSRARVGEAPSPPAAAVNLPIVLQWTEALLPPLVLVERRFVSDDPKVLAQAAVEAERLPDAGERALRKADVLHDQKRLVEALAAYDRALSQGAAGDAGWKARVDERRGQTLLELGRLEEAEAVFRQAIAQAPGAPAIAATAGAGLALTLLAAARPDAARAEATAAATALPAQAPGSAWVYLALAVVEIRRSDLAAANTALASARAADPRNGEVRAWTSYLLRSKGDLTGAEEEARQAVALAPGLAASHQALADVLFLLGRAPAARREAQRAVASDPLSAGAHVSLANANLATGRVDDALREAHQGVALDPRSAQAQYALAAAAAAQRQYGTAERHVRQALELEPGLLDARSLLSRVLVARGDRRGAEQVAQATLAENPKLPSARASLGQVYRLMGRLKEAAREYEAALALSPRDGIYHVEVARVYLDLNAMPDALRHAQEGVFLLPESSDAHAILGLVYDRQQSHEQAVREYREAISLSPENSLARLGLVTAFTPRSREIGGSGREQPREQAQALLRDPAVLQQTFKPGVTSELLGGAGGSSHEEQRYLHRDQFLGARLHDLSVASRFSDGGDRRNASTNGRLLQTNLAFQATPRTQILLQASGQKESGGLPGPIDQPDTDAYLSRRNSEFHLSVRQYLGADTHLWVSRGIRALRVTRNDLDAPPALVSPALPPLSFYSFNQRGNYRFTEARLDHRVGRHVLTYGVADLRLNARPFDFKFALPGAQGASGAAPSPVFAPLNDTFTTDWLQYLQDDYRIGRRGTLILGTQLLRSSDRTVLHVRLPTRTPPLDRVTSDTRVDADDLLPYGVVTYNLDARNLVRILGQKTKLRVTNPLLEPSEAFIVGEPVSVYFSVGDMNGSTDTYELDYEHRFTARTFAKLFLQYSWAHTFLIQPSQEQQFLPISFVIPTARLEIAGLRFEHQIGRYLSAFTRWSYWSVEDRTSEATGLGADPNNPIPNPSRGLQVPFAPRWRGLTGLNYVDRAGTKVRLTANFLSRQFTDTTEPGAFGEPGFQRNNRPATGAHLLFDLAIAREPSVKLEYGLAITNLFNTKYQDVNSGFLTRGRTWIVTLAARY